MFLFAEFPGASHRRCRATVALGGSSNGSDGHEARSSVEAARYARSEARRLYGVLALRALPSNAVASAERCGRCGDATAAATAAATTAATATAAAAATADVGSATQQHRELTNNGGDSPVGARDSSGRYDPVSGPEPSPQDRAARAPSGTQAGSRLQEADQAVTHAVDDAEDAFVLLPRVCVETPPVVSSDPSARTDP